MQEFKDKNEIQKKTTTTTIVYRGSTVTKIATISESVTITSTILKMDCTAVVFYEIYKRFKSTIFQIHFSGKHRLDDGKINSRL